MQVKLKLRRYGRLGPLTQLLQNNGTVKILLLLLFLLVVLIAANRFYDEQKFLTPSEIANVYKPTVSPTPIPLPTPTPTPKPLTFAEMNALYGPCVFLPTLMYHHIQDMEIAKLKNQQGLTVSTETFKSQMQYLKDKGYQTTGVADLINFFDNGTAIAKKSILLTFDDAYDDFYLNAYPILSSLGLRATVFTPTGLVNNPGYLSWSEISEMANGGAVFFANHTWSHKNMMSSGEIDEREISTADLQLTEKGLDDPKVFAYPYGLGSSLAENLLNKYGYKLAFTTKPGSTLCKKQRLELPRVRIGNVGLGFYGF